MNNSEESVIEGLRSEIGLLESSVQSLLVTAGKPMKDFQYCRYPAITGNPLQVTELLDQHRYAVNNDQKNIHTRVSLLELLVDR